MVVRRRQRLTCRSAAAHAVNEIAAAVQLPTNGDLLRRFPHQLSGGQAQRAAIALSLAAQPDLLVLDEPTSGLDPLLAASVLDALAEVFEGGTTAGVVITHDDDVATALADRVVQLASGRVVATGTPAEVLDRRPVHLATSLTSTAPSCGRLTVRDLSAAFGTTEVVSAVGFEVGAGEALAVVGASGSGKTTMARCVVGLHRPSTGTVHLDGTALAPEARRRRPAQRRAIQLVAQDAVGALNPRESARLAVERPLRRLVGLSPVEAASAASSLLQRVRLDPTVVDRRPSTMSGGERQRVNLARALAARPDVLVCDEPTASLDPDVALSVVELLDELRRDLGLALVIISHDLRIVVRAAERALVLDHGRMIESGTVEELVRAPAHPCTAALVAASPALAAISQSPRSEVS
jgi:peptide/nickel transport system ATP-binding protein